MLRLQLEKQRFRTKRSASKRRTAPRNEALRFQKKSKASERTAALQKKSSAAEGTAAPPKRKAARPNEVLRRQSKGRSSDRSGALQHQKQHPTMKRRLSGQGAALRERRGLRDEMRPARLRPAGCWARGRLSYRPGGRASSRGVDPIDEWWDPPRGGPGKALTFTRTSRLRVRHARRGVGGCDAVLSGGAREVRARVARRLRRRGARRSRRARHGGCGRGRRCGGGVAESAGPDEEESAARASSGWADEPEQAQSETAKAMANARRFMAGG